MPSTGMYWEHEKARAGAAPSKGRARKYAPPGLDYHALEGSIEASVGHYWAAVESQSFPRRCKDQIKRRKQAIKMARDLVAVLREMDEDGCENPSKFQIDCMIHEVEDNLIPDCKSALSDLEWEEEWGLASGDQRGAAAQDSD